MASGKTHSSVTIVSGIVLSSVLSYLNFQNVQFLLVGFMYQVFCSPDRDLNQPSIGEYYLRKFTLVLNYYWRGLWYPYSIAMKHRGKSHAVYGTIVRFLYLISPFIMLVPRFRDDLPPHIIHCAASQFLAIPIQLALVAFVAKYGIGSLCLFITGVLIGDLLHLAYDKHWFSHRSF